MGSDLQRRQPVLRLMRQRSQHGASRLLSFITTAAAPLLTISFLVLACGGIVERRPGDVLLITVDALRPDHLGLYGYERPTSANLDRWLADAALF